VTFTATVTNTDGSSVPQGTVTFSDSGGDLCTAVPLVNGVAACTSSFGTAGSYPITADYNPAPGFLPASAMLTETVMDCADLGFSVGPCADPKVSFLLTLSGITDPGGCPECPGFNGTTILNWAGSAWAAPVSGACVGTGPLGIVLQWDPFSNLWLLDIVGDLWVSTDFDCTTGMGTWTHSGGPGPCNITTNPPVVVPCS
jgi:hypothetical protein